MSETIPLIPGATESRKEKPIQDFGQDAGGIHPKHNITSGKAVKSQATVRLRLRHSLPALEAWWIPRQPNKTERGQLKRAAGINPQQKANQAQACDRLEWLTRLRPKPHRQRFISEKGEL
jgi:hypothetical protein